MVGKDKFPVRSVCEGGTFWTGRGKWLWSLLDEVKKLFVPLLPC